MRGAAIFIGFLIAKLFFFKNSDYRAINIYAFNFKWGLNKLTHDESVPNYLFEHADIFNVEAVDFTKINKDFGWKPSITFKEALAITVDWCLSNSEYLKSVNCGYQHNTSMYIKI